VSTGPPLLLEDVHKAYGATVALHDLSLAANRADVLALLGPNGAGKTTALSILLGLRRPDHGRARLLGEDPRLTRARRAVGATPQATGFPGTLRVGELIELVRAHYAAPAPAGELLERFGLAGLERRQAGGLSGGQQRRLALALAFAGDPEVLVLDEPTTGLDVEARGAVWREIRGFAAAGGAVLLTTHYLEEAEALATHVAVIAGGRLIVQGDVAAVRARARLTTIRLAAHDVPQIDGVVRRASGDGGTTLYAVDGGAVVTELVRLGVPLVGLEVAPASLEEALAELSG
jgi:ABC-2 type transport system ATP-binding protein